MADNDFSNEFGIDPRHRANIRSNSKNLPEGIDWEALLNAGTAGTPDNLQTDLGFVNDQQKRTRNENISN